MSGRNLIKQPWAFIGVPYMNPTILGVIDPGFLNQVPTLGFSVLFRGQGAQVRSFRVF